eukprot:2830253-Amphidinium_carterae.1
MTPTSFSAGLDVVLPLNPSRARLKQKSKKRTCCLHGGERLENCWRSHTSEQALYPPLQVRMVRDHLPFLPMCLAAALMQRLQNAHHSTQLPVIDDGILKLRRCLLSTEALRAVNNPA